MHSCTLSWVLLHRSLWSCNRFAWYGVCCLLILVFKQAYCIFTHLALVYPIWACHLLHVYLSYVGVVILTSYSNIAAFCVFWFLLHVEYRMSQILCSFIYLIMDELTAHPMMSSVAHYSAKHHSVQYISCHAWSLVDIISFTITVSLCFCCSGREDSHCRNTVCMHIMST